MTTLGYRREDGFTMIELMVTIAVAAILVGIAVPSFQNYIVNTRSKTLASDLSSALNLARTEAVTRSVQVTVCPSDGAACGGTWVDGWVVIVDGTGELLRTYPEPRGVVTITQTPAADTAIRFGPLGQPVDGATQLSAWADGCQGNRARQIDVAPVGRVSTLRIPCP
ncbi:MAG: GspH/FimT family pseudopilin [Halieaceae bacterium]|jgi:type IV fimbrial biogenesis protein FimT|nr:GspH/FimT family pseudopilin [Halieaceae bacterium]